METTFVAFPINKSVQNNDGTITVYGIVTDESLDYDKQICDGAWLDKAVRDWFEKSGNIREQHSNIAAGKAISLEKKGTQWWIKALVVDAGSVAKVKLGVLKEFSVGIRSARLVKDAIAKGGRIVDGWIGEVSLVDRGANMNAKFVIAKSLKGDSEMEIVNKSVDPATGEEITAADIAPVELAPVETPPVVNEVVADPNASAVDTEGEKGEPAPVEPAPTDTEGEKALTVDVIKSLISEAITSVKEETAKEVEVLKSVVAEKEAELTKVKSDLAEALNKAVAGGPSRTIIRTEKEINISKALLHTRNAERLLAQSEATTDKDLAKSYKLRADDEFTLADEINKSL